MYININGGCYEQRISIGIISVWLCENRLPLLTTYKDGKWDEGGLITDANVVLNECAGVFNTLKLF